MSALDAVLIVLVVGIGVTVALMFRMMMRNHGPAVDDDPQLSRREQRLAEREAQLGEREHQQAAQQRVLDTELERVAGLSIADARAELVKVIETQAKREAAHIVRDIETAAREEGETRARKIVTLAIQRIASEQTAPNPS